MPLARAQELAATRMQTKRLEANSEAERQSQEVQQHQAHVASMATAADAWSAEKKTSDPDWHLKQDRVVEMVELHLLKTKQIPASVAEVRKLCDEKLALVEKDLKRFAPKPQPARTMTSGGASQKPAADAPTSILDVVRQTLNSNS